MATYVPAKVSTQYIFFASVVSQANTKLMQVNPTIAAGDFKVSIDGGALANLGTLPAVTPAGSSMIKFTLSTSEMAGANATVVGIDAAGSEWCDITINIQTAARQIDDLCYPTVSGRGLDVSAGGEAGLDWANIGSPTTAQNLSATNIDVDQVVASVSGAVGSVTGAVGSVTGAVGSVTGAVGSVTGAVGSVAAGGITAASIATGAIDADAIAADAVAEIADGVWDEATSGHTTAGTFGQWCFVVRAATAQTGAASSITLDASASATNSIYFGQEIQITAGTGAGQSRLISAYNGTTKVAGVKPDWTTTPDNTSVFLITRHSAVDVEQWSSSSVASPSTAGVPLVDVSRVANTVQTAGDIIGDTNDIQARLPAALTADGNIKADTLRVGGTLQTAGDLAAMLTTIDDFLDTEIAAILAAVDTEVAAIKAKTDSLTFTVAGQVDSNLQYINDVAVLGDGAATPWGP